MTPVSRREILGCLVLLSALLYFLMPWSPIVGWGEDFDYTWRLYLHAAFAKGLGFGSDIVFTYGPLGFLQAPVYYPETRGITLALTAFLCVTSSVGLWFSWGGWIAKNPWLRAACLVAMCAVAVGPDAWFCIALVLAMAVILTPNLARHRPALRGSGAASRAETRRRVATVGWILLAVSLAMLAQMKATISVVSIVAVGSLYVRRNPRRALPGAVRFTGVFALTWLAIWVLCGQSLGDLGIYLSRSAGMISHYPEAISFPGPLVKVVLFAVNLAALALLVFWTPRGYCRMASLGRLAALCAVFFLLYKATITRNDAGHLEMGAHALLCIAVALCARVAFGTGARKRVWAWLAMGGTWLVFWACTGAVLGPVSEALDPARVSGLAGFLTRGDGPAKAKWMEFQAKARELVGEPVAGQTLDIYPSRVDLLLLAGHELAVRPTVQSYMAYGSAEFLELNAAHLLGPQAPSRVVLQMEETIDKQYFGFYDSVSWPLLLSHYDLKASAAGSLILEKAPTPRAFKLAPMKEQVAKVGEVIQVPPTPPGAAGVWAAMAVKPSFWGKVRGMFYIQPVLLMDITLASGKSDRYRFLPGCARASFLVSPRMDFGSLWPVFAGAPGHPALKPEEVRTVKIDGYDREETAACYGTEMEINWYALYFEPQPGLVKTEPGP